MSDGENYILQKVKEYFDIASSEYKIDFPEIIVKFNIKGTTSGTCACYASEKIVLRFNMEIFRLNREQFYEVIIHEVAHGIVFKKYKSSPVKPHGKEWKKVVTKLGGLPKRCHNYIMPPSKKKMFKCNCNCDTHMVSKQKYTKIGLGYVYNCTSCKGILRRA